MAENQINRIVIPLDFADADSAWQMVVKLGDRSDFYKVGLQLLTAAGPDFVRRLVAARKRVFLDLKLLEIPNSVAGAVDAAGKLGVSLVTVHASGGRKVMEAAVEAARSYPKLKVLALTVITSMNEADLADVGVAGTVVDQVRRLADLASASGCDGVVASPLEANILRSTLPCEMLIVTPGVQLSSSRENDQVRVATPRDAIQAGASLVVIGRSVTASNNPVDAFCEAQREVDSSDF